MARPSCRPNYFATSVDSDGPFNRYTMEEKYCTLMVPDEQDRFARWMFSAKEGDTYQFGRITIRCVPNPRGTDNGQGTKDQTA